MIATLLIPRIGRRSAERPDRDDDAELGIRALHVALASHPPTISRAFTTAWSPCC